MLPLPISATPGLPVGVRHASEFTTWAESKITKKNFYPTGEDREAHLSKLMAKDAEVIRQRTEYETREREREQRHKADIRAELDARIERFRNDPGAYFVDFSPNAPIPEKYHRPSDIIALKPINLGPKRDIALFHNPKTDECVARDVTGMSEEAISQFADEDEYQLLETRVIAVADLRHLRASPSKIEQSYQKALEIAKGGPSPD